MKKIMQKALSIILAVFLCIPSMSLFAAAEETHPSREWFVSLSGDDASGDGSIDKPFRSLQKGVDMLGAGDTLYIREGVYDEFFKVNSSGTADAPITIKPYQDEKVTVRATTHVSGWSKASNIAENAWVASIDVDKAVGGWSNDGVFIGEKPLILARFPNIPEDGSKLHPPLLQMDEAARTTPASAKAETGYIVDAELTQPDGFFDGAVAHMQSGLNWYNVIANVVSYTTGRLELANHNYANSAYYNEAPLNKYYIENHINCLDAEGEFFLDQNNKQLYIISEADPNQLEVGIRSRSNVCDLSDVSYVNVEHLDFRGAAPVLSAKSHHVNFDWISMGAVDAGFYVSGHHNTIRNSHLYDAPGNILTVLGEYNAIFNCLIEDGGWMGGNSACVDVDRTSTYAYFAYNTVRRAGRYTLGQRGTDALYEYNHCYDSSSLTCDTGICYSGVISGGTSEFRYNWLHDITAVQTAFGLYFDNAGNNVAVHHNVVWDNDDVNGELRVDGWGALLLNESCEGFSVYNNTFIGGVRSTHVTGIANDSRFMNNIVTGNIQNIDVYKMQENNIVGWLDPGFTDMRGYDFTLTPDSIAIDKGRLIDGVTDSYVGDAPDLGAYEYGGEAWVPGHNWENPPVFEHKTPNYIQWHNLVTHSSFEDNQGLGPIKASEARMWDPDKYGWSIMENTQGAIDQTTDTDIYKTQTVRRIGNSGVKLGDNMPTTYPGDETARLVSGIVDAYNGLMNGYINYPKWRTRTLYEDIPEAFYELLINSCNMVPGGDFEEGNPGFGAESSAVTLTEEDAATGSKSMKYDSFSFSWSGLNVAFPATKDRIFRISFDTKSTSGNSLKLEFIDHHPTDWSRTNDRRLGDVNISYPDNKWNKASYDLNTRGNTQGISMRGYLSDWKAPNYYYIDNFVMLDITELYLMKEICGSNKEARTIIDDAINNRALTAEGCASAMRDAAKCILEKSGNLEEAVKLLFPILETLRDSKLSAGAGIAYKLDNAKPGRTYKLMCHAYVNDDRDKVQFTVKHNKDILAQWETNSKKVWTDEFITFVAPENGDPVTIEIWKPQGIGSAFVDDVTVNEYDPKVYPMRSNINYMENTDFESGDLWPWYSFDGALELVPTDMGTSLKVTNGRAMQNVISLPARKIYDISGDFKLAMPEVASKEAELLLNVLEGTTNGTHITYPIAKGTITNDGWVHLEGEIQAPADLRFDSIGITAGLVGGEGTFYVDNVNIAEHPMPTEPGTGDQLTFDKLLTDVAGWVCSSPGGQGMSITAAQASTTAGNMGYQGDTFRDFKMTFEMKINDFKDGNYPSLTVRSAAGSPNYGSGYSFFFFKDNIELQKNEKAPDRYMFMGKPEDPSGAYGPAVYTDIFKMGEWNTVTVGTANEEDGVRIYLEVNGQVIYDYLDHISSIDNAGYISFNKGGVGSIYVRPKQN